MCYGWRANTQRAMGDGEYRGRMAVEVMLIDADGVIQYAPQKWSEGFAQYLACGDPDLERRFAQDIFAAETACLSRADGFDAALHQVLTSWDRVGQMSSILGVMLSLRLHEEVLETVRAVRATGIRCYVASNQQSGRASFMSNELGYASRFDGELYSCHLGAAKPSELYFTRALAAVGSDAGSTLFIDDRPENVEGARRCGFEAFMYDGHSGAEALKSRLRKFGITI